MEWQIKQKAPDNFLLQFSEINSVAAGLLYHRGITEKEKIEKFLNPDFYKDFHDPFLMTGMEKAVKRIIAAIDNFEKVVIFGDYDADGVSASALAAETLKLLGADVSVYIPDREKEGYGMNLSAVQSIIDQKAKLIITVDCGISDFKETELAQNNGVDVIITDHHPIIKSLPPAYAIVNPKQNGDNYPFKYLAGVGVVYKLVCALLNSLETEKFVSLRQYGGSAGYLKWCLDIVALGTVADVCPLVDENRIIVKFGLLVLEKNRRIGLAELLRAARIHDGESKLSLDAYDIGYQIGPRLNASGRMDHAGASYQLLTVKSEIEARALAMQIEEKNTRRQNLTKRIIEKIKNDFDFSQEDFIFASLSECPAGVAGLVAGKLCDEFAKPAFIISEKDGISKGSCRAPEYLSEKGFHLGELLSECGDVLNEFGGHAQAAGFSIKVEMIQPLKELMRKIFFEKWRGEISNYIQCFKIDYELFPDDINWRLLDSIKQLAPFGKGNLQPVFALKNASIFNARLIGNEGKHLKLSLRLPCKDDNINYVDAIAFGFGNSEIKTGDLADLAFYLEENEWNGNRSLRLRAVDIKKSFS